MTTDGISLMGRESYEGMSDAEVRSMLAEARRMGYEEGHARGTGEAVMDFLKNPMMCEAAERARKANEEFDAMVRELTGEDHG